MLAIATRLLQCISPGLRMHTHHNVLHACRMLGTLDWMSSDIGRVVNGSCFLRCMFFRGLVACAIGEPFAAPRLCRSARIRFNAAGRVSCISFAKIFDDRLQVSEFSSVSFLRARRLNDVVQEGELPAVSAEWLDR